MGSAWNDFTKKIYEEGKKKNPKYKFSQALKDASKRKSEMGVSSKKTKTKRSKRGGDQMEDEEGGSSYMGGKKSKRRRGGRKGTRKR